MARKMKTPKENGGAFPQEAYQYSDDVTVETVAEMRKKVGIDFESGDWKVIDGLGQVVSA